jgi:hypothetical protein
MLSRCSSTSERDHLARIRLDLGAVRRPGVHQLATLVEQVAASVGRLHRIGDSAISATSRANVVRSAAQSRKVERKPWVVMSP